MPMQIEFDLSATYPTVREDQCSVTVVDLRATADIFEKILAPASKQLRSMLTRLGHTDQIQNITFGIKRGHGFDTEIYINIKIDNETTLTGSCSISDRDLNEGKFTADKLIIAVLTVFTLHHIDTLAKQRAIEKPKKPVAVA